jgi:biotin transporter BioY
MDTYYTLGKLIVATAIVVQCSVLAILTWALKHHRNRCFTMLVAGQVTGLVYAVLVGIPYFVTLGFPAHLLIIKIGCGLFVVGGVLGVWGTLLLVRAYLALAKQVSGDSVRASNISFKADGSAAA